MNLKQSGRWSKRERNHCTRGTINRWFDELSPQSDGRIDPSLAGVPRDEESVEGFGCHAPEIPFRGEQQQQRLGGS
jgi:hypothetical protein